MIVARGGALRRLPSCRIIEEMPRTDLHIKVVVEHEPDETIDRLATEICRAIERVYSVETATVSNVVNHENE